MKIKKEKIKKRKKEKRKKEKRKRPLPFKKKRKEANKLSS